MLGLNRPAIQMVFCQRALLGIDFLWNTGTDPLSSEWLKNQTHKKKQSKTLDLDPPDETWTCEWPCWRTHLVPLPAWWASLRGLILGLCLHLHPYFVYGSRGGCVESGKDVIALPSQLITREDILADKRLRRGKSPTLSRRCHFAAVILFGTLGSYLFLHIWVFFYQNWENTVVLIRIWTSGYFTPYFLI